MTAAERSSSFADSIFARLIALVIAILIGWQLYANWADDFRQLFEGEVPALPIAASSEPVKAIDPALKECLDQRVGDVDRMKEEGVLSDAQYSSFRERAEQLCRQQNPGEIPRGVQERDNTGN